MTMYECRRPGTRLHELCIIYAPASVEVVMGLLSRGVNRAQVNETPQLGVAGCGRVWLGVAGFC